MKKIEIVFLGGRLLGYRVLKWLIEDSRFEIKAVCLIPSEFDRETAKDLRSIVSCNNIKNVDIDELNNIQFKVGISINYNKIISEDIIKLAPLGFWNIHHSYNLLLRGRNITTHAILNSYKDNIYYHGTTLHKIVPELDDGPIVASQSTEIKDSDTAQTLFYRIDNIAYEIVKDWIPRICFEEIYLYQAPKEGIKYYKNSDLPSKEIPGNISDREFYDYVRAFDFCGYSPAYMLYNGKKVELVLTKRHEYEVPIKIHNRVYFTNKLE